MNRFSTSEDHTHYHHNQCALQRGDGEPEPESLILIQLTADEDKFISTLEKLFCFRCVKVRSAFHPI